MIVLVTGGRWYWDWYTINEVLDLIGPSRLIHGGAQGADTMADNWAKRCGLLNVQSYPIRRPTENGFMRNARMLRDEPTIDLVVAFPGGNGTADMVRRARASGIPVIEVK